MHKKDLKGKDLLLMLLYAPGITEKINEPVIGRTRITKMIFIFEKEALKIFDNIDERSIPEFFSYNYGPFSKELFDDIKFFKSIGFVKEEITINKMSNAEEDESYYWISFYENDEDMQFECKYYLTDRGKKYVEERLWNKLSETQKQFLHNFKYKINSLTLDMLLAYVYNKYEEYTKESQIRHKYIE